MTQTLATSKFCGPCHMLKSKLKQLGIEVETKDYSNPEHIEWFRRHNIRAVPRLVIQDGDKVEIIQGIQEIIDKLQN